MNGDEQLRQFQKYPIAERFRLYNKVYNRSGHPHEAELSIGFRDRPKESINYVINDLEGSNFSDFLRYLPIIYDLGKRTSVDICGSNYITSLKKIIAGYHLSPKQLKALEGLRFDRCELP